MRFCPPLIHPHQHLRPILSLCPSCSSIDFQYSTHAISLLTQHIAKFKILNQLQGSSIGLVHLLFCHHLLLIKVKSHFYLISCGLHLFVTINPLLNILHLLHLHLCFLWIIPETRSLSSQLLLFKFYLFLFNSEVTIQCIRTFFKFFQLFYCDHNACNLSTKVRKK